MSSANNAGAQYLWDSRIGWTRFEGVVHPLLALGKNPLIAPIHGNPPKNNPKLTRAAVMSYRKSWTDDLRRPDKWVRSEFCVLSEMVGEVGLGLVCGQRNRF